MPGFPDAVAGLMSFLETYDSPSPLSAEDAESTFGVRPDHGRELPDPNDRGVIYA
jgi:hypothetical protein